MFGCWDNWKNTVEQRFAEVLSRLHTAEERLDERTITDDSQGKDIARLEVQSRANRTGNERVAAAVLKLERLHHELTEELTAIRKWADQMYEWGCEAADNIPNCEVPRPQQLNETRTSNGT